MINNPQKLNLVICYPTRSRRVPLQKWANYESPFINNIKYPIQCTHSPYLRLGDSHITEDAALSCCSNYRDQNADRDLEHF